MHILASMYVHKLRLHRGREKEREGRLNPFLAIELKASTAGGGEAEWGPRRRGRGRRRDNKESINKKSQAEFTPLFVTPPPPASPSVCTENTRRTV